MIIGVNDGQCLMMCYFILLIEAEAEVGKPGDHV